MTWMSPGEVPQPAPTLAIPAVTDETSPLHTGTTTLPTTPFETLVFGRGISRPSWPAFSQTGLQHSQAE